MSRLERGLPLGPYLVPILTPLAFFLLVLLAGLYLVFRDRPAPLPAPVTPLEEPAPILPGAGRILEVAAVGRPICADADSCEWCGWLGLCQIEDED